MTRLAQVAIKEDLLAVSHSQTGTENIQKSLRGSVHFEKAMQREARLGQVASESDLGVPSQMIP